MRGSIFTPIRSRARKTHGFSLVELSVVVAIMSVVAVMGLEGAAVFVNRTAYKNTQEKLAVLDNAVRNFYRVYQRLPCPADQTLAPTSTSYGLEQDCKLIADGGVTGYTGLEDLVLGGAIPFRTLNLPMSASLDAYGNKFRYVATKKMSYAVDPLPDANSGAITVRTGRLEATCTTVCQQLSADVAYVILSYGADKRGAVNRYGVSQESCLPTPTANYDGRVDSMNCVVPAFPAAAVASTTAPLAVTTIPNNVMYDSRFNNGSNETSYFDDILIWRAKGQL